MSERLALRTTRWLATLLSLLSLPSACQLGTSDVQLGFHVTKQPAGGASGTGGAPAIAGDCSLPSSQGTLSYSIGEVARLEGVQQFVTQRTSRCASTRGCANDPADVVQSTCDSLRCQLWHALEIESGWYVLSNLQNGGCLDVGNGSMADGATIQAFACHARDNQRWQAVCAGQNTWRLVSKNTGLVLGVHNSDDGGLVQQWTDSEQAPELWSIESQPNAYSVEVATSEAQGQTWRYTTTEPAPGWDQAGFDDSAWLEGEAGFGTRYEAPWTARTGWNTEQLWLRRSVILASAGGALDLRIFHNGPFEVYLNGQLAYQHASSVGYRVVAVSSAAQATVSAGANTLAVHGAVGPDQSFGPYFDLGLGSLQWR